jgi:hypothetical protein
MKAPKNNFYLANTVVGHFSRIGYQSTSGVADLATWLNLAEVILPKMVAWVLVVPIDLVFGSSQENRLSQKRLFVMFVGVNLGLRPFRFTSRNA